MKSAFSLFLVVTIAVYANISEATDKQSDIVPAVNQLVSLLLDGPSEQIDSSGFEQLKVCEFPAIPEACEVLVLVTIEGHSWGNSFDNSWRSITETGFVKKTLKTLRFIHNPIRWWR
jgi:hypothetical protein